MQLAHRLGEVASEHVRQHTEGKVDAGVELLLLGTRCAAQDEVGDQLGITWMANTEPQAMEVVLVAELRGENGNRLKPGAGLQREAVDLKVGSSSLPGSVLCNLERAAEVLFALW